MKKPTLCLLLLAAILPLTAVFHMAGYFRRPGSTGALAISGNIGYLAAGDRGLRVLDLSDPVHPVTIMVDSTGIVLNEVQLQGHYLYALGSQSNYQYQLQVYLVDQPETPVLVSQTSHYSPIEEMEVEGDRLYFHCWDMDDENIIHHWLETWDVSDPAQPDYMYMYHWPTGNAPYGFCAVGTRLFLAYPQGFKILDVSLPQAPQLVFDYPLPSLATDVLVRDSLAFVSSASLYIFDLVSAAQPFVLSQLDGVGTMGSLSINGNSLFGIIDNAYALRSIDVSDPQNPVLGGYFFLLGYGFLTTNQSYAYLSHWQLGLSIVDVTEPLDASLVGTIPTEGEAAAILVEDGIAYVTDQSAGIRTYDVSNPAQPQPLGSLNTGRRLNGLVKAGNLLYLSSGYWDGVGGLEIVNVADPANPALLSYLPVQDEAAELAVNGDLAYLTDHLYGLKIYDVGVPSNPAMIGFYDPPGYHFALALAGNIVCLVGYQSLCLIDVSNPHNPIPRGEYPLNNGNSVAVSGTVAYVADTAGVLIIDIANPDAPTLLGTLAPHSTNLFLRCRVQGDRLYTSDFHWHEVLAYDISVPQNPLLWKSYPSNFIPGDMFASGNLLFATHYEDRDISVHDLTVLAGDDPSVPAPNGLALENYPNPFNPSTTLRISLPEAQQLALEIYNLRGQKVRGVFSGRLSEGVHSFLWDGLDGQGRPVASGVYLCRLAASNHSVSKRMLLLK